MDIEIDIDSAKGLVSVRVSGTVSNEDLLAANHRLLETPGFRPSLNQLVDMRQALSSSVDGQGVRLFMDEKPLFASTSKRAFVVSSDLGYGLARMIELKRDGAAGTIVVFRQMEDALAWLADSSGTYLACNSDN